MNNNKIKTISSISSKRKKNENFENNLKDLQFHNFLILIIENMKDKSKKR